MFGCRCGPPPLVCRSDGDCDLAGEGFLKCNVDEGSCFCVDDRGCSFGETCNPLGRCQVESGCASNGECRDGFFCDVVANQCIADNECGNSARCCVLDSQCPFREVCNSLNRTCTPGCRDEADCFLGEACVRSLGQPLGTCDDDVCDRDNLCGFGQLCNSDGRCVDDNRGPYCDGCSGGVQSDDCGTRGNFCLLDLVNGGSFCGVTCVDGEECPFGYECRDIIILPPAASVCDAEACEIPPGEVEGRCAINGGACVVDNDCPIGFPGGTCARAVVGNCKINQQRSCSSDGECGDGDECIVQECRYREGANQGTCSCTRQSDCSLGDRCTDINPATERGRCQLSGHVCFDDADCESIIQCINGGCFIGRNCAPASGRTCRDFLDVEPAPID